MIIYIELPAGVLAGLNHIAPKKDVREQIRGVRIAQSKDGRTIAESTDGRCLMRVLVYAKMEKDVSFTIHRDAIDALKISVKDHEKPVVVGYDLESKTVTLAYNGLRGESEAIDLQYPDTDRVIPLGKPSGVLAQFNPEILMTLNKAVKIMTGLKNPVGVIAYNGHAGARVFYENLNVVAVAMPFRAHDPLTEDGELPEVSWSDRATRG